MIAAKPDIIVGSWCGKKFVPAKVAARPGFDAIPAVRDGCLREIKSTLILQPGPAALTDGLAALEGIVAEWAARILRRTSLAVEAMPGAWPIREVSRVQQRSGATSFNVADSRTRRSGSGPRTA